MYFDGEGTQKLPCDKIPEGGGGRGIGWLMVYKLFEWPVRGAGSRNGRAVKETGHLTGSSTPRDFTHCSLHVLLSSSAGHGRMVPRTVSSRCAVHVLLFTVGIMCVAWPRSADLLDLLEFSVKCKHAIRCQKLVKDQGCFDFVLLVASQHA